MCFWINFSVFVLKKWYILLLVHFIQFMVLINLIILQPLGFDNVIDSFQLRDCLFSEKMLYCLNSLLVALLSLSKWERELITGYDFKKKKSNFIRAVSSSNLRLGPPILFVNFKYTHSLQISLFSKLIGAI